MTDPELPPLPTAFVQNVIGVHGQAGRDWLDGLPTLLTGIASRWNIALDAQPFDLSYHYVIGGTQRCDGLPVALKLGVPCPNRPREAEALRAFDGRGAARLLDAAPEQGALLVEHICPGTPLLAIADDEAAATRAATHALRLLRTTATEAHSLLFPTVADWARGLARHRARFDGGTGPLPEPLFAQAEALFADLLASSPTPPVLLHGDLHHGNLLLAADGAYRAIDPHGVLGDPAFEPSAFLLNPAPRPPAVLARRMDIFADELGMDRERIRQWAIARAVLSAVWTIEDGGCDWEEAIAVGERLSTLG